MGMTVSVRQVGAYVGGFGTGPGLKTKQARAYEGVMSRHYPELPAADGFVYNYFNAAWAMVQGLEASGGDLATLLLLSELEIQAGHWKEAEQCEQHDLAVLPVGERLRERRLRRRPGS